MKICLSCEGVSDTPAERCSTCGARLHALDAVHFPARRGEIDAANPLLGAVIDGKYRLVGVLGRGGLGTVFRAQHVTSLMYVALKLLHPRFAERAEYRRALVPEARRAATVANDRCARLLDVGETEDGAAYLAMELVEGRTLDLLVRDGPLAPAHAVAVLAQVADALAAIHAAGLVHCDLSPRNVMVAARGGVLRVKVLDFGIARSVTLAGPSRARGEFHGFANPAFAAPELLAGREVDARADLYSFGTLAWLLLTGAMPVDDADPRRAAAAIAAGELRPWPEPRGVGRRLRRLVLQCLQREPAARPASSLAVARELAVVGGARRPRAVRAAAVAWAAGAIAVLAAPSPDATPFLQTKSGSPFALVQAPLAAASPTVHATSAQLAALRCDFAGLDPRRLRVDLVRDGELRQRTDVRPDVAPDGAGLALLAAQPGWREVVAELVRSGQERPSDVVFGVPGAPPLGGVRLRVDDQPPEIEVDGAPTLSHLRRDTLLRWRAKDRVGLARLDAVVAYADGRTVSVPLAPDDASCALGERLAAAGEAVGGGGEVAVVAVDRAGNVARAKALAFAALDVAPPQVVAVTGPGGEAFVPAANGVARARVQLAAAETGARVQIAVGGGEPRAFEWPAGARAMTVDVPATAMAGPATWRVLVRDAAGNETAHEAVVVQRDLDLAIVFPRCDGPARAIGGELVVAPGGRAVAAVGADWRIDSVAIERPDGVELPGEAWSWERGDGATAALAFAEAPAGAYQLQLRVSDRDDPDGFAAIAAVPLRVLPPRLVVRLPAVEAPYLPALLAAGVLQPQAGGDGAVYGEGPAWSLDAALRPYVRARGQRRAGDAVSDIVHEPTGPARALLPAVRPTPGRNRYALAYEDVLQRPVALVVGGREVAADEPFPVVDFWWTSEPSRPVGEELFAEHGKPLRVRVRCPLPFAPSEAEQLRLACAQSELAATSVRASGRDGVEVVFDVPFAQWSAAANLSAIGRDEFAAGLERRLDASLATPAGREPLALRLRTVRSTLQATSLGALRGLPTRLAAVRLLPVLPPRTPFAEPVPAAAPPRAAFRPQPAVAVRNLDDFLLQQDEFRCGPARDLVGMLAAIDGARAAACVHAADPAGVQRMTAARLLPAASAGASDDAALVGVDYFQAHALAALLGVVLADDPAAVRLPLGCELEAAAFAGATLPAAHAARAHGGGVAAWPFLPASAAADPVRCGDVVPTAFGEPFVGLDFGVREWVLDLPVAPDALALLREWMADRTVHLARIADLAQGRDERLLAAFGAARALGVVRGLAFGEADGVIDAGGGRIDPAAIARLPDATPGVLRTEQLRRDGRDLLSSGADPRLARVGFRVLVEPARLPTTEVRR